MIRFILIIAVSLFVIACKETIPSTVLKPNKMQEVLWDVLKAEALAQQLVKADSSKSQFAESQKLTSQVFLIHNITKEEFDKSYTYYIDHPDKMRTIFDSLSAQKGRINIVQTPLLKKVIADSLKNRLDE